MLHKEINNFLLYSSKCSSNPLVFVNFLTHSYSLYISPCFSFLSPYPWILSPSVSSPLPFNITTLSHSLCSAVLLYSLFHLFIALFFSITPLPYLCSLSLLIYLHLPPFLLLNSPLPLFYIPLFILPFSLSLLSASILTNSLPRLLIVTPFVTFHLNKLDLAWNAMLCHVVLVCASEIDRNRETYVWLRMSWHLIIIQVLLHF